MPPPLTPSLGGGGVHHLINAVRCWNASCCLQTTQFVAGSNAHLTRKLDRLGEQASRTRLARVHGACARKARARDRIVAPCAARKGAHADDVDEQSRRHGLSLSQR